VSTSVALLLLLDFAYIGALPRIFFRRDGRLGPMWWATAAPFFLCAAWLLAELAGIAGPAAGHGTGSRVVAEALATVLGAASIALISFTLGTHRVPLALWHQDNDRPASLVTHGAYGYIRHPFYAAFLLALLGALVAFPHPVTLLTFAFGAAMLNATAAREERRLQASPEFGAAYAAYLRRTGRFLPRWRP